MFGILKFLVLIINEDGYMNELLEDLLGELIDIFDFINMFNIGYNNFWCVFFYIEEEIWISVGSGIIIKCFIISGNCMNIIKIK